MTRFVLSLLAIAALLAMPAGAAAQGAPPSDSELDQYIPSFPGAEKERGLGGGDAGRDRGQRGAIPAATVEALRSLGPSGQAAAEFAQGSAPKAARNGKGGASDGGSSAGAVAGALGGGSSGGGMGILLPLLLAAIVAGGILYALRHRGVIGSSGRE